MADQLVIRFKFSDTDREVELDLLSLKARERVELEEFFKQPWADLFADGWLLRSTKGAVFLGYLARRRKEPRFTYNQALDFEAEAIEDEDLSQLNRKELNARAEELGIEKPEKLQGGRDAVIAAIETKQRPTETPPRTGTQS